MQNGNYTRYTSCLSGQRRRCSSAAPPPVRAAAVVVVIAAAAAAASVVFAGAAHPARAVRGPQVGSTLRRPSPTLTAPPPKAAGGEQDRPVRYALVVVPSAASPLGAQPDLQGHIRFQAHHV